MTDILSLPPELLSRILDYVPGRDLPSVSLSCKTLRDVVYVDSVWQGKCKQVLRRYGDLVGFWKRDFEHYGGLLQIKYDEGCIKGLEVLTPASSRVDRPVQKKEMFTISMTSSETVQIVSVHNFPEEEDEEDKGVQRPCLLRVEQDETKGRVIEYKVTDKKYILQKENLTNHPVLRRWLNEELESDLEKGVAYLSSRHEYRWSPMELPSKKIVNAPIQPGLFKGLCSPRGGIEILRMHYNDDLTTAFVTNITGDQIVPAGKFHLFVKLNCPMVLTVEQQESKDTLFEVPINDGTEQSYRPAVQQPFRIPNDFDRNIPDIPKFCTFRCLGVAYIKGYTSVVHFVVFDERKFGVVLRHPSMFCLYIRVDENELED